MLNFSCLCPSWIHAQLWILIISSLYKLMHHHWKPQRGRDIERERARTLLHCLCQVLCKSKFWIAERDTGHDKLTSTKGSKHTHKHVWHYINYTLTGFTVDLCEYVLDGGVLCALRFRVRGCVTTETAPAEHLFSFGWSEGLKPRGPL